MPSPTTVQFPEVTTPANWPPLGDVFGIRSLAQVGADLRHVLGRMGRRGFQLDLSSIGNLRPHLALPAYAGRERADGLVPIMNLFDRVGGGRGYSQRVTRRTCRDYRGGRLSYDEHDGVDFVCPVATPVVAAAAGTVVLLRDRWLRGGLTMTVDHGAGLSTQYSHLTRGLVPIGTQVRRGEVIALSGASGIDMTTFFPWVAPHVHFMAWQLGRPVDPFLAEGEASRTGTWQRRNEPAPADEHDASIPPPQYDAALAREVASTCSDPALAGEIARIEHEPAALIALLEDSLHHDRWAWPERHHDAQLQHPGQEQIHLSLPLGRPHYRGVTMADNPSTAPPKSG